jgi:glycerol-3-phosphate cytidylyltransferase
MKGDNMKTGIIAGNFDVIHPGYMKMFKECKQHCDYFVVLLHDDPSVERPEKIKPILSVDERVDILMGIRYIDNVVPYKTEADLLEILHSLKIDVRFLGDDYLTKRFTGDDLNIPIHWIQRNHDWSTTKFKNLIAQSLK